MINTSKQPVGRPRLYKSPEKMQAAIDKYFKGCEESETHPTVARLCYDLGFEDRTAFTQYEKYPEFSHTIRKARLYIEAHLENHLYGNSVAGAIFNLKNNFKWKDTNVIETKAEHVHKVTWSGY